MSHFNVTTALWAVVFFAWMVAVLIVVRAIEASRKSLGWAIAHSRHVWIRASVASMVTMAFLAHFIEPVVLFIEKAPFI